MKNERYKKDFKPEDAAGIISGVAFFCFLAYCYNSFGVLKTFGASMERSKNIFKITGKMIIEAPLASFIFFVLSVGIGFLVRAVLIKRRSDKDSRGFELAKDKSQGRSQVMSREEKQSIFGLIDKKSPDGIILGVDKKTDELITIPWKAKDVNNAPTNDNLVIFGESGSRKTSGILIANIYSNIKAGNSLAVTDPKGELYRETIAAAKYFGYNVRIFNLLPNQFGFSDGWDMLRPLRESPDSQAFSMATLISNIIIENTTVEGSKGNEFFDLAGYNCLKLALLTVAKAKNFVTGVAPNSKGERRTMEAVYDLIQDPKMKERCEKAMAGSEKFLRAPFNTWAHHDQAENIRTSIATKIGIFQDPAICKILSEDEIDFIDVDKQPTIIYIITSDKDDTYKSVLTLFTTFMFRDITSYVDEVLGGRKLSRRFTIMFEEFANIGKIQDLPKYVSTLRSRGISVYICYQSIAQIMDTYGQREAPNEWETILANCAMHLCIGANDELTAKHFEFRSGKMTVVDKGSYRRDRSMLTGLPSSLTETSNVMTREAYVYMSDEILHMQTTEILISPAKHNATMENKYYYKEHPLYSIRMADEDGNEVESYTHLMHMPKWKERELSKERMSIVGRKLSSRENLYHPEVFEGKYVEELPEEEEGRFRKVFEDFIFEKEEAKVQKERSSKSFSDLRRKDRQDAYITPAKEPDTQSAKDELSEEEEIFGKFFI